MSERLLRTFISVTVPNEIIPLRDMLKTTVKHQKKNLRWVITGQIHLTLKFLGFAPPDVIDELNSIIAKVISRYTKIDLTVTGTGCFPVPTRPRVLWLGMTGQTATLTSLVSDLNTALEPLGFPAEEQKVVPHITLARIKYPPKHTPDISAFLQTTYDPILMTVSRVQFTRSELFPDGPVYSILGTHFLAPEDKRRIEDDNS
ncbi:MAG TPA: RNA 2',3'-cyclic phosphodiesterase [Candidatus Marinimicrobia bacterium]|nr:RNA 2',3'-cyclic phosphodiesterase [Candidatus Neomarinimicrobiota bacterium]